MKYEKSISLKYIAHELGVSINTVSRALRDCDDISLATKGKVREMAIKLGYLPNNIVYSFNDGKTKSVTLIINNVKNYYFSIMNEKLLSLIKNEGYIANIVCLQGNSFDKYVLKNCVYQRVDKIISFVEPTKEALELVDINHLSLVVLGRKMSKKYCDSIYTDDIKGGCLAADYLIKNSCKNFIYIHVLGSECSVRRYKGFKDQLLYKKYNSKKINIEHFDDYIDEISKCPNLGIFVYNDEHLYIVMDKLMRRNVDISNIKFIGYDNISKHILGTIKIPSIAFDYDELAETCVKLVKNENDGNLTHKRLCFDVHLEDN